ncbi:MAG: hypothetical protein US83_C0011G0018 [Candidatus Falkowbacteria bacterium GW2011_GWC2_38_22]|uniref:Uncharacterized protein n=1 Tax=Candidatus Falkowbacteria bacterium GW2011_GWE1_38_31 TaxID=1618638 RepID=A0A0G0K2X8_9BACT|nr:MAG: hypothetical protein US73_C0009G0018 [Candidatus Falkowbacteria bacterium GW2011_GWF2_38_1205]KKQ60900.1 MAG: hypothetical protein US83_C0011G0018 [Candidatus Falkowbacteria bacterium GW2011_GWC2_38_22]KKQ63018.1 MAG: hypothetical protein US84_C0009G0018 [Candidatus Falkowbacteria bacterium GW2011_GWF1_38_22]KKQ65040.1 MAG: hypothetical protein US87_C0009G0018 [Candidatus Falkowbacteria bacterium GW2011_GWE2_38_254]KKQ69815.1 MAG: hypothetical protein US91_C0009G0018 [Candidatus Falkowb
MGIKCSGEDSRCLLKEEFETRKALGQSLYSFDCPDNCPVLSDIAAPGGDYAVMKPHELHGPAKNIFVKALADFVVKRGATLIVIKIG